jgi:hypothetical protein
MEGSLSSSEDTATYSNPEPFGREDEPSLLEPSNGTGGTTHLSTMDLSHMTDSAHELPVSDAVKISPEIQITTCQSPPNQPATFEDSVVLEPEVEDPRIGGAYQRPNSAPFALRDLYKRSLNDNSRNHYGDIYYNVAYGHRTPSRSRYRDIGFDFDMETSRVNKQQLFAFESAYESREVYTSKKRPVVSLRSKPCTCSADRCLATYAAGPSRGIKDIHASHGHGGAIMSGANRSAVHRSGRVLCSNVCACGTVKRCH